VTVFSGDDDVAMVPSLGELPGSLEETLGATFGRAFGATARDVTGIAELDRAGHEGDTFVRNRHAYRLATQGVESEPFRYEHTAASTPDIPVEEARTRVGDAGLAHILKLPDQPTIRAGVLDIMMDRARKESEYQTTLARGPSGITVDALNGATALAAGAIDPTNIALSFIPVVGEERAAALLAGAGRSFLARGAARAGVGAVQGAAFSAATVPLEWYARSQEGQDFTSAMALREVLYGAATFGLIHAGGGAATDIYRALRGRPLYPFAPGEPHARPAAAPPAAPGEVQSRGTPPAGPAEVPAGGEADAAAGGEAGPGEASPASAPGAEDVTAQIAAEASPFVRAIADLPPNVQQDNMRMALAKVIAGEPVNVGDVLATVAQDDPRVAGSLDLVDTAAPPRTPEEAEQAVHDDVYAQLRAAGMGDDEAAANAAIVAARYAARAARLGVHDAFALYHSEGLQEEGGAAGGPSKAGGLPSDGAPAPEARSEPAGPQPSEEDITEGGGRLNVDFAPAASAGPRGRVMLAENRAIIDLFKTADASTFMHEMGHKWLEEMIRDAAREEAPKGVKDDLAAILRWLGVERPHDIGVDQHERFARGFEQYLAEGKAPSSRLAAAFERFKQWLARIYRAVAGQDLPISDEVRGVFDRLLATDEEIAAWRAEADLPPAVEVRRGPPRGPRARPESTWSLLEFLASRGGVRPSGEMATILGGKPKLVPGFGPLVRKTGMALDRALEAAIEAGYFVEPGHLHGGANERTVNDLLDAIDREARGQRHYRIGSEPEAAESRADRLDAIEREVHGALADIGIDPNTEPSGRLARVIEIMDREGAHDAAEAYERAIMEEARNAVDDGRTRPGEPVTGWDVPDDAGAAPGTGGATAGGRPGRAGAGPRDRGEADRAADAQQRRAAAVAAEGRQFAALSRRDPPEMDSAAVAQSRAAERAPDPASIGQPSDIAEAPESGAIAAKPSKRLAAALKDEAQAIADYDAAAKAGYLSAGEMKAVDDAIALLDQSQVDYQMLAERGAACLAAAVG
jgi:hypothetical protein